jgi:hypothetical protein
MNRPVPSPHSENDFDDDLDFGHQNHNHQRQEDKMVVHPVPPFDEPARPLLAGLLFLIPIRE